MRIGAGLAGIIRGVVWIFLITLAAAVYNSRLSPSLTEGLFARVGNSHQTVLPARIEPGTQVDVISEFSGQAEMVSIAAGQIVQAGDVLVVLKNTELTGQLEAAQKRLDAASAHLASAQSKDSFQRTRDLTSEQLRTALRAKEMADERLMAYSLKNAESAMESARKRTADVRQLVSRGIATSAEFDAQQAQEQAAARDLESAREHLSRLKQEVEQADSQLQLLRLQTGNEPRQDGSPEADLADARAALMVARERADRLTIRASKSGTVLETGARAGEWTPAGQRIARIADLSTLTISAPVAAGIAQQVKPGRKVLVRLPIGTSFETKAKVSEVTLVPGADQAYVVRVVIPNPDPKAVVVGLEAEIELDHGSAE